VKDVTTTQLARSYLAGASLNQLARDYPICRSAILYRLRRAGVTMRPKGAARGNTPPADQQKQVNRCKHTMRQIACLVADIPTTL
jgi:hypothetical protein